MTFLTVFTGAKQSSYLIRNREIC